MKTFYAHIILLLLGCSACKTDALSPQEELPAATQEGLNTFGCLVNGEVWVPKPSINPSIHRLTYEYHKGYFQIIAKRNFNDNGTGVRQTIAISIESDTVKVDKVGTYKLDNQREKYGYYSNLELSCSYKTTFEQTGTLEVPQLDTTNHIIAGTFEFTVWTEECDTIRVTDGRFDIKYLQ